MSSSSDPALLKALAEASTWIVTLHGPERTPAVDRGFQHWLAESPLHRRAFEHATETWSKARATVRRSAQVDVLAPPTRIDEPPKQRRRPLIVALAAAVIVAVLATVVSLHHKDLTTGIGERRTVVLEDGTQVTLNTATRLVVEYDKQRRQVRLEAGEAFFEVARRPERPFVVRAGNREVRALGTAFLVRRDAMRIAVTLVEGKIAVMPTGSEGSSSAVTPASPLAPGERIVFTEHEQPQLDHPEVAKLTAWEQGLVNIDNLTLTQAVAEMNRYNTLQLVVTGPAANIRVSGVFRITDSENLAKAVALTHGLQIHREAQRIVLSGTPRPLGAAPLGH